MFREMRRKNQMLSEAESIRILEQGSSGVLALLGERGYPYAVPLSYIYHDHKIFFHAANSGQKIDAIRGCEKASFCVIEQEHIVPEEYTTYFRSVIVFGKIRIIENEDEKREEIERLALKYHPRDSQTGRSRMIEKSWESFCMLELSTEHISGKEAIELKKHGFFPDSAI